MTPTCTVLNFHNLHSLTGLFGNLVFEQTESSDWCWFVHREHTTLLSRERVNKGRKRMNSLPLSLTGKTPDYKSCVTL